MPVLADTHVHLYPCHDAGRLFRYALDHLAALAPAGEEDVQLVLCMTERSDCRAFRALAEGTLDPAPFRVVARPEPGALLLADPEDRRLVVLAGRQINTAERIEVLALGADLELPDGQPIREVIPAVRAGSAVPVVAWAPGKWFFARGKIVSDLVADAGPGALLLGDSSLRPLGWCRPPLMNRAREKGLALLCGSDPLPFAGEEQRAGTYAVHWAGTLDLEHPVESLRTMLAAAPSELTPVGRRNDPLTMALRLKGNRDSKKREPPA